MKKIQIIGTGGCVSCRELAKNTALAVKELGLKCEVKMIIGKKEFCRFGAFMIYPVLVIDNKIIKKEEVPTVDQIKRLILDEDNALG